MNANKRKWYLSFIETRIVGCAVRTAVINGIVSNGARGAPYGC